jgi:hypothetical protein
MEICNIHTPWWHEIQISPGYYYYYFFEDTTLLTTLNYFSPSFWISYEIRLFSSKRDNSTSTANHLPSPLEKHYKKHIPLMRIPMRGLWRCFQHWSMLRCLDQPWATRIGSRANFLVNSHVKGQNIDFYFRFSRFFYEIAIFLRL